ncbi:GDP-mannose 4,6-dehydratase [Rhizobium sp. FY34]|uniref:GDP-mannose 4,6-dehydratase n=1 Tax=Rhizobium sp. FY34 TaxID=2562309 RepID=UPI0014855FE6|nr:GDP-mannose 4,6-dehydratase [Rhizobium sp. FY34]
MITGASGFVGSHLVTALKLAYPKATLSLLTRGNRPGCIRGDVTDVAAMQKIIGEVQPDCVMHLAARSTVTAKPGSTWRVNVGSAIALAEAIAEHAPKATVLNVSSSEVYGSSFLSGRVNEGAPIKPLNVYGRTKIAAEAIFADILSSTNRLINVRPFNHTGPGQDERFVVPSFAAQIARIESSREASSMLVGNLESLRDFLDVRDVVRAYVSLLQQSQDLPMRSVFNICSGQSVPVRNILGALLSLARTPINVEQDPERSRPSDIPSAEGDCSALQLATGWQPQIPLEQTLADILEQFRRHHR